MWYLQQKGLTFKLREAVAGDGKRLRALQPLYLYSSIIFPSFVKMVAVGRSYPLIGFAILDPCCLSAFHLSFLDFTSWPYRKR